MATVPVYFHIFTQHLQAGCESVQFLVGDVAALAVVDNADLVSSRLAYMIV